jgi:hypothetical protein
VPELVPVPEVLPLVEPVPELEPEPEVLPLVEPVLEPEPEPELLTGAEHDAIEPPLLPTQLHVHNDPMSETARAVPALHRFVVGALVVDTSSDEPHAPFTTQRWKCRALAGVMASIEAMTNTFQIFICIAFS